jgi:hypothetical protein
VGKSVRLGSAHAGSSWRGTHPVAEADEWVRIVGDHAEIEVAQQLPCRAGAHARAPLDVPQRIRGDG